MSGSQFSGFKYSRYNLFQGQPMVLVPPVFDDITLLDRVKQALEPCHFGSFSVTTAQMHDEMIAFLSQLTHCIAVSLMCANDNPGLVFYTGDSFRDLTRIANINDDMWSELFLSNREALLKEMEKYRNTFDKLYDCVKNNDREEMRSMMRISTERRGEFNKKKDK